MKLQGAMAYAMLKAQDKMSTTNAPNQSGTGKEAMWLWMKDHPNKTAMEIAAGTQRNLQTTRADLSRLLKEKLVRKAQDIRFQLPTTIYNACGSYPPPKDPVKVAHMQAISAARRAQREAGTLPPPKARRPRSLPSTQSDTDLNPFVVQTGAPPALPSPRRDFKSPALPRPSIKELDLEGYSIRELRELRDRINDMLK